MAKKHADRHPSKKTEKPPSKAGVMMYEDTLEGRKLLVGYNEGRFAKNGRYLVLPKGSVDYDKGETTLRGGMREFGEETGFHLISQPEKNIEGFFTEDQIELLERGEVLEHITNPRFPGFEIVRFDPKSFLHEYHARSGDTNSLAMYGIEVKGLDSIVQYLKNADNKTTKDFLDKNRDITRFPKFLSWLQEGYIPADGDLPRVELCDPKWFEAKEKLLTSAGIEVAGEAKPDWEKTRKNWQKFCKKMEKDGDYKILRQAFHAIKQRMVDKGFVQDDNADLKFDEKDCPLFWYTEGVLIDYARPILAKIFTDMKKNDDYARAFGGAGSKVKGWGPAKKATLGQIGGFKDFVSTEDWLGASVDAHGKVKPVARNLARLVPIAARTPDDESTPAHARA